MIDMRLVGRNIIALRRNRRWTQRDLAEQMNVSHQAVSKWEKGHTLPDIQTLLNMSRMFGVSLEMLLTDPTLESGMSA